MLISLLSFDTRPQVVELLYDIARWVYVDTERGHRHSRCTRPQMDGEFDKEIIQLFNHLIQQDCRDVLCLQE